MDKLLIKRGSKRALEQIDPLPVGELFLAKDEERLYVGGPRGNISLPTQQDLDEKATKTELQQVSLAYKESYDTLDDLKKAYPNGDVYNHVVLADGMIYTYAKGEWISTGVKANGAIEFMKAYEDLKVLGVGRRNLLLDSGRTITNNSYLIVSYHPSEYMEEGEIYTVTICVTPGSDVESIRVYTSNGYMELATLKTTPEKKQVLSATFVAKYHPERTPIHNPSYGRLQFFRFPRDEIMGSSTIHWAKLEKGNKATDWTPAPEDINAHPFVVELAETVFRSKQNEERIRNLENAITALGGNS